MNRTRFAGGLNFWEELATMSETTKNNSSEVREQAVRLVLDHECGHPSRLAAITLIATNIGYTAQIVKEWVKKAEVDTCRRPACRLRWLSA